MDDDMNTDAPCGFEAMNLDGTWPDDLRDLAPVLRLLADYADRKARAMDVRTIGKIALAMQIERQCERIYNALPKWARW